MSSQILIVVYHSLFLSQRVNNRGGLHSAVVFVSIGCGNDENFARSLFTQRPINTPWLVIAREYFKKFVLGGNASDRNVLINQNKLAFFLTRFRGYAVC